MIKRRFYRADHGDNDAASSDSSSSSSASSSDSEFEAHSSEDADHDGDDVSKTPSLKPPSPSSSSSAYESEDSSANQIEVEVQSPGLLANDVDSETGRDGEQLNDNLFLRKNNNKTVETLARDHPVADNLTSCILKSKSVFKCRFCPKIICLNEESLKAHLNSKRHARSEKLLNDGRLKRVLNSDGEEVVFSDDDDGETHAERHARIVALAQSTVQKKGRGRQRQRQRQRQRFKRKKQNDPSKTQNNKQQKDNRAKRRRKSMD